MGCGLCVGVGCTLGKRTGDAVELVMAGFCGDAAGDVMMKSRKKNNDDEKIDSINNQVKSFLIDKFVAIGIYNDCD